MTRGSFRRLRTFGAALLALVSALALIGDKLEAIGGSPLLAHIYVLGDVFIAECVLLLILIVFYPKIRHIAQGLRTGIPALRRDWFTSSLRERLGLLGATALGFLFLGFSAYHGSYYLIGKRLLLARYPSLAIMRADSAFSEGRFDKARWSLRACADVIKNKQCAELLEQLDRRERLAHELRTIATTRTYFSPAVSALLFDSYEFDKDSMNYRQVTAAWDKRAGEAKSIYLRALHELQKGNNEEGLALLRKVNRRFPGYGNSHKLIEEATNGRLRKPQGGYLLALQRYGADQFSGDLTATVAILSNEFPDAVADQAVYQAE